MAAPHRPDIERPRGLFPGIPHEGAIVAFAAAVFVGTLLAAFSARSRGELGGWWAAAMAFAIGCWLTVVVAGLLGRKLSNVMEVFRTGAPRAFSFFGLTALSVVFVALVGLFTPLSASGLVLTSLPLLLAIAYYWSRDRGVDTEVGIAAGLILFLICIRLFTMPGRLDDSKPKLAGGEDDDVWVLSWNVGGGAPGFSAGNEEDIGLIARTIKEHGAHVVCLQEVPSAEFLENLRVELGAGWRGQASAGEGRATAVLSRIGGIFETPLAGESYGGPCIARIASDRGVLNFVSCHVREGRHSEERRKVVDWLMNRVRSPGSKTVIAGDFSIDPLRGWSFLRPVLTDSANFDKATWRALNVLGSDPGFGGAPTASLGRRTDWVVVDSKMAVSAYRVLESARGLGMDHSPVLVRVGRGKAGRKMAAPGALGAPRETLLDKSL